MRHIAFVALEAIKGFLWTIGFFIMLIVSVVAFFTIALIPVYLWGTDATIVSVVVAFGLIGGIVRAWPH